MDNGQCSSTSDNASEIEYITPTRELLTPNQRHDDGTNWRKGERDLQYSFEEKNGYPSGNELNVPFSDGTCGYGYNAECRDDVESYPVPRKTFVVPTLRYTCAPDIEAKDEDEDSGTETLIPQQAPDHQVVATKDSLRIPPWDFRSYIAEKLLKKYVIAREDFAEVAIDLSLPFYQ